MKVAILGGYGNFGARMARALVGVDGIDQLLIGGRSLEKAKALAQSLGCSVQGVLLDAADENLGIELRKLGVGVAIHVAGPFQGQGYQVARACAAAGCHYVDLADGRRFVCDFEEACGDVFKNNGVLGVSGASTLPAVSSAVIEALSKGWSRIDSVSICIAPGQKAPRGVATLEGVLSYCGEPVKRWSGGAWGYGRGWGEVKSVPFISLRPRRAALCDVPDLELFPKRYGVQREVWFGAALEVGLAQRGFEAISWLRGRGWMPSPKGLAGLLFQAGKPLDALGSPSGAMRVDMSGIKNGASASAWWEVCAPSGNGPEIPCMAAIELAIRLARGEVSITGAVPCVGMIALSDFEKRMHGMGMITLGGVS